MTGGRPWRDLAIQQRARISIADRIQRAYFRAEKSAFSGVIGRGKTCVYGHSSGATVRRRGRLGAAIKVDSQAGTSRQEFPMRSRRGRVRGA